MNTNETELNLNNCCRTCLQNRQCEMKPLSTEYTDNLTFAQMLMGIIRIVGDFTADEEDLLRICSTCESDLITAYNFKTICQTTETILSERKIPQKILKQIETEILKNDDCSSIDNDGIKLEPEIITTLPPTVDLSLISNVKQPKKRGRKPKVKTSTDNEDVSKGPVKPDELAYTEDEPEVLVSGNATDQMPTPTKRKYDRRSTVGKVTAEKKTKPRHRKATPQSIWCRRCDITFDTGQLYQQHYKKVHQYKSPCSLCGKTFYTYDLDKHITTHSTEKFTCTVCGNRLKNKNSLREHMRIHTGEKRYKCDFCDERFIHWNSKKCHMYVKHTHERKYECYICQKRFGQRGGLKIHILYHTGELPHPCPFCEKRFPKPYNLRKHIRTHRDVPVEQLAVYLQT